MNLCVSKQTNKELQTVIQFRVLTGQLRQYDFTGTEN